LFENPNEFIPERWLVEDGAAPTPRPEEYTLPASWGGPRLCLGKDMARLEAVCIAHLLVQSFEFELMPHSEKITPSPVQFYAQGVPMKVHLI